MCVLGGVIWSSWYKERIAGTSDLSYLGQPCLHVATSHKHTPVQTDTSLHIMTGKSGGSGGGGKTGGKAGDKGGGGASGGPKGGGHGGGQEHATSKGDSSRIQSSQTTGGHSTGKGSSAAKVQSTGDQHAAEGGVGGKVGKGGGGGGKGGKK
jgi:hypothetical protein